MSALVRKLSSLFSFLAVVSRRCLLLEEGTVIVQYIVLAPFRLRRLTFNSLDADAMYGLLLRLVVVPFFGKDVEEQCSCVRHVCIICTVGAALLTLHRPALPAVTLCN